MKRILSLTYGDRGWWTLMAALAAVGLGLSARGDAVLFQASASRPPRAAEVQTNDATVTLVETDAGPAWRVATGFKAPWPGVTLLAPQPEQRWDLSQSAKVVVTLRNRGKDEVKITGRVDNPGANGTDHCVSGSVTLPPEATGELHVTLTRARSSTMGGKLFGMRGYPVAAGGPGTVEPSHITQILLFVAKSDVTHVFDLLEIQATGTYVPPTAWINDADPFFPFMDTFGQYRHKDWPGKVHSVAELQERRRAESEDLARQPGSEEWDRFGGWVAGPQLEKTGFFRVQKYEGKWWLVDPEGRLFWSHGIDCVRMMDVTPVAERETWFEDFPGDQPELASFIVPRAFALKGHYTGQSIRCFSFAGANLRRKYGEDWKREYAEVIHRRLRSWGLNTIANWSDTDVRLMRRTPYTDTLSSRGAKMIEGSEGYWGKFPDPFDESFAAAVSRNARSKADTSAGDPWCLGFFCDNEIAWGNEVSLAMAALRSPADQAAKRALITDLRQKYGDIARLNDAWETRHASWDALIADREGPAVSKARSDLETFYSRLAEAYFRQIKEALKAVAPRQLFLGCRFAWVNARAAAAAAKYCDVVSYNLYRRDVAEFQFNGGADVPLIIGEFHFGALDRGMFHTGLVPVASQADRAEAYRSYVEGALRHPQFVGTHWFQYMDEPTTGRVYDEENYQIGFVDIADTPYRETRDASRAVGRKIYQIRSK